MYKEKQNEFYAHISEDRLRFQTVLEHLEGTADLASKFAASFNAQSKAYLAGMLHDIGKYSKAFQRRLEGSSEKVDHSTAGAKEAFAMHQPEVAFTIAGHHAGLPDGGCKFDTAENSTLLGRMKKNIEPYSQWKNEIHLSNKYPPQNFPQDSYSSSFFTRMLYSCLVDADFLDTENFMSNGNIQRSGYESIPQLLKKLENYIQPWWNPKTELNHKRCEILRNCLDSGHTNEKGLYTLTVPTGGGKTVSSLAFALSMACEKKMDRVIYVIPYTSIIDQTAKEFSKILGKENIIEHHSGIDYTIDENSSEDERKKALAIENWDAPVIVTTAVQFFESLYANRTSRCRKLHNIANSVIIFDEAQTIPVPYLMPCTAAIAQLVMYYGVTAVLCTATQPALDSLFQKTAPNLKIKEICHNPQKLYEVFRRTKLQNLGEVTKEELTQRLQSASQVLCVVNRRKTAQDLYSKLTGEGNYCLTTLLYPEHRKRLLDEIRARLKDNLPCRVISTSLIEAGVDVDFPVAYREETGLESILQTAGRCNREGLRKIEDSPVYIFKLSGQIKIKMLEQNIESLRHVLSKFDDPSNLDAIENYFKFYRNLKGDSALDQKNIIDGFIHGVQGNIFPFATLAGRFQLIGNETYTVYIPLEDGVQLIDQLRQGIRNRTLFRKLGKYGVNIYPDHLKKLDMAGKIEWLDDKQVAILTDAQCYDMNTGLSMDVETGNAFFI